MCSLCGGGKGKEEVGYLSKSLDFSFSINVNGDTYHLRCLEKSVNLMYIFSDILKAVRFHKWQVNLKWGYCNFQRKEQQLLSVCIFYLGGRELSFILHNSWTDVSTQVALNLSLGWHLLFLHESLNNSVSKVYSCWIIVCLYSKFQ